jgi:hypothetical protein
MAQSPKLRTVNKVVPPFPLNEFPKEFPYKLGRELVYLLASKGKPVLEGPEWEEIFAACIDAEWKPSNVGLDDVILGNCTWGAKTVKGKPTKQKQVRLISGRNSPVYSFGDRQITDVDPNELGEKVLAIWNDRVSAVREKFKHVRTVVLIKAAELDEVGVFEFETVRFDPELFYWKWNKRKNLEGYSKHTHLHRFTWQPHGAQFTVLEDIPENALVIRIKLPRKLNKDQVLKNLGFDKSWITVLKKKGV